MRARLSSAGRYLCSFRHRARRVIRLMKNERRRAACQLAGTAPNLEPQPLAASALTPPPSSASPSPSLSVAAAVMGLQPLGRATARLPQLAASTPSGVDQNCNCVVKPLERTILHGILTGQGYKFGYGESYITSVYADSSGLEHSYNGIYVHLKSLEDHTEAHSREVTSPSKCTIPLRDK